MEKKAETYKFKGILAKLQHTIIWKTIKIHNIYKNNNHRKIISYKIGKKTAQVGQN
jgi:hypothetical protein